MNMTEQNQQGTCPVVCLQTNIRLRLFLSEWKTQETNTLRPLDDCHRAVNKASNNVQALNDTSVKLSKITTQVTTRRDHISVKQLFHRVTYDVMTQSTSVKLLIYLQVIHQALPKFCQASLCVMYQISIERHNWKSTEEVIDSRETVKVSFL